MSGFKISPNKRKAREERTIKVMVRMFCREHHGSGKVVCRDCRRLLDYARSRFDKCPFRENKPTCENCPIHCYRPEQREKIRSVMRYSGPRMLFRHPVLTVFHLIERSKKVKNTT